MESILLPPEQLDGLLFKGLSALHDDLRRGWHAKSVLAVHRQARIAKAFQDARPLHHETLGQLTMVVDPVIFEEMRREHGADCWRDAEFRRRFAAMNPECRIRSKSKHTRVAVNGMRKSERGNRNGRSAGACTVPTSDLPLPTSTGGIIHV